MFVHPRQYDSAVYRDMKGGGGVKAKEKEGPEKGGGGAGGGKREKARAFRQKAL